MVDNALKLYVAEVLDLDTGNRDVFHILDKNYDLAKQQIEGYAHLNYFDSLCFLQDEEDTEYLELLFANSGYLSQGIYEYEHLNKKIW